MVVRTAERSLVAWREEQLRLQDASARIRVRATMVLMIAFVALAEGLGLEVILGSFAAGALQSRCSTSDQRLTHPSFRTKLEAMGFGLFIPVFNVTVRHCATTSESQLDDAVEPGDGADLPGRSARGARPALPCSTGASSALPAPVVAGVLQATSLPFIVAATAIGMELGAIDAAEASALIAAGLLSCLDLPDHRADSPAPGARRRGDARARRRVRAARVGAAGGEEARGSRIAPAA